MARLVGATLIALFILGVTLPSMSRGKTNATVFVFMATPVLMIYAGAFWSKAIENVGWALLILLLFMRLAG